MRETIELFFEFAFDAKKFELPLIEFKFEFISEPVFLYDDDNTLKPLKLLKDITVSLDWFTVLILPFFWTIDDGAAEKL